MNQQKPDKIKTFLNKIGLTEKETDIYLYSLTHGPQHVSRIATACKITRTNAYDIVKKLETKGLCYNMGSLYGRKIKANPPKQLNDLISLKEKEVLGLKNELDEVLLDFKEIKEYKSESSSTVSYFKGKESLRKLINMTLQVQDKKIIIAGSELDIIETLGKEFLVDYNEKRVTKKIKLLALRPGPKRGQDKIFENDKDNLREVRIRPENEIRLKSVIIIWDSFTAFCSFTGEPFGTLIENDLIAKTQKSWFDFIWSKSKIAL